MSDVESVARRAVQTLIDDIAARGDQIQFVFQLKEGVGFVVEEIRYLTAKSLLPKPQQTPQPRD